MVYQRVAVIVDAQGQLDSYDFWLLLVGSGVISTVSKLHIRSSDSKLSYAMQMGFFSIVGIPLFQALAGLFKDAQVSHVVEM